MGTTVPALSRVKPNPEIRDEHRTAASIPSFSALPGIAVRLEGQSAGWTASAASQNEGEFKEW